MQRPLSSINMSMQVVEYIDSHCFSQLVAIYIALNLQIKFYIPAIAYFLYSVGMFM